jgi:hypothetical protein
MGRIAVACYRPKPGREDDLLAVVVEHVPTLQRLGFAAGRAPIVMRAADGTIVEIFEWAGPEAKRSAHEDPAVRALWERFESCSEPLALADLAEAGDRYANFDPVDL